MAVTITITLGDNDPRTRLILAAIAPPPATEELSVADRILAVTGGEPATLKEIVAGIASDGASLPSRQTIANTLQRLKREGRVTLEDGSWRVVEFDPNPIVRKATAPR